MTRFKKRECRQCGNVLLRVQPPKPVDDFSWMSATRTHEGSFFCEKCHIETRATLVKDEPRDIELAPRVRA